MSIRAPLPPAASHLPNPPSLPTVTGARPRTSTGKYHPHGDQAVYDSLVRMAQDFSMRQPLVNGHGNFGSLDNDPAAAMRYTECKLQPLAEAALLSDIGANTVDYTDNFDSSRQVR